MRNMENLSKAVSNYFYTVRRSWTWEKLNPLERENFIHLLLSELHTIKGTYKNCYMLCNSMYAQFLEEKCNYRSTGWRESNE